MLIAKQKTVAKPRDGRVGFEGLGYLLAEVWKTETGQWDREVSSRLIKLRSSGN